MVRRRSRRAALCAMSALLTLTLAPTMSHAQDDDDEGLSFGEEEARQGGGDDDEGLEFGEEEAQQGGEIQGSDPLGESTNDSGSLAVVAVKTEAIDDAQRQELQEALDEAMTLIKGYELQGGSEVLSGLNDRGPDCVRESICLARVGGDASADKLLLARITQLGETYKLDVDFFDVNERIFIGYETIENLGSPSAAIDSVEQAVRDLFKVRALEDGVVIEEQPRNEWVQPTFAYTSAALAAGALVGGVVFGRRARGEYDELVARSEQGQLSQVEARAEYDAINAQARRANLFYGLGAGLGVLSAVLFTVDFGSDVADDDEYVRIEDLRFAPSVSAEGGGLGASFRF